MKHALLISAITLSLIGLSTHYSQATTINFDDVVSGTVINTQYTGLGATFDACNQCPVGTGGNVYAVDPAPIGYYSAESSPNVVTVNFGAGYDGTLSAGTMFHGQVIQVTFSTLQSSVSIDVQAHTSPECVGGGCTITPLLFGLDSSGHTVSGNTGVSNVLPSGSLGSGAWTTLTVTDPTADIKSVLFGSSSSSLSISAFDNLCFSSTAGGSACAGGTGGDGGNGNGVPEPSSLLLLGSAVAGLGLWRKFKARS